MSKETKKIKKKSTKKVFTPTFGGGGFFGGGFNAPINTPLKDFTNMEEQNIINELGIMATELCIAQETQLRNWPIYHYIPQFIKTIEKHDSPQIHILTTRIIFLCMERVPKSLQQMFQHPIEDCLLKMFKTCNNTDFELVEEIIKCFDKICIQEPEKIVKEEDLFPRLFVFMKNEYSPKHLQPLYLRLIMKILRRVDFTLLFEKNFENIVELIKILLNVLREEGKKKTNENCLYCFGYLVQRFQEKKELFEKTKILESLKEKYFNITSTHYRQLLLRLFSLILYTCPNSSNKFISDTEFVEEILGFVKNKSSEEDIVKDFLFLFDCIVRAQKSDRVRNEKTKYKFQKNYKISQVPLFQWFWEDDFHNFTPYDAQSNKLIEEAYEKKEQKTQINIRGIFYEIDLLSWRQYNKNSRLMRNIFRNPIYNEIQIVPENIVDEGIKEQIDTKEKELIMFLESVLKSGVFEEVVNYSLSTTNFLFIQNCVGFVSNLVVTHSLFAKDSKVPCLFDGKEKEIKIFCLFVFKMFQKAHSMKNAILLRNMLYLTSEKLSRGESKEKFKNLFIDSGVFEQLKSIKFGSVKKFFKLHKLKSIVKKNNLKPIIESIKEMEIVDYTKIFTEDFIKTLSVYSMYENDFCGVLAEKFSKKENLENFMKVFKKKRLLENFITKIQTIITYFEQFSIFKKPDNNQGAFPKKIKGEKEEQKKPQVKTLNLYETDFEGAINIKFNNISYRFDALSKFSSIVDFFINIKNQFNIQSQKEEEEGEGEREEEDKEEEKESEDNIFVINKVQIKEKCYQKSLFSVLYEDVLSCTDEYLWGKSFSLEFMTKEQAELLENKTVSSDSMDIEEINEDEKKIISVLELLKYINNECGIEMHNLFINEKLSNKMLAQIKDTSSSLYEICNRTPQWIKKVLIDFKFILNFECKKEYLLQNPYKILSRKRNTEKLMQNGLNIPITRKKDKHVIKDRKNILEESVEIFLSPNVCDLSNELQFEYEGEPGVGLGPTLELFTAVSKELQKSKLDLFINRGEKMEYVVSKNGLFPKLEIPTKKKRKLFKFMGKFIAKALDDSRLIDISMSNEFLNFLVNESKENDWLINMEDLKNIDEIVYNSIKFVEKTNNDDILKNLELNFQYGNYILKKGGQNIRVCLENKNEYLELLKDYLFNKCLNPVKKCFLEGFSEIIPSFKLRVFRGTELINFFVSPLEVYFTPENIIPNLQLEAGYNKSSKMILDLVSILCDEMDMQQKKNFLEFVTGCTQLPIGGFKNLVPKMTIMKLINYEGNETDERLPTANTCFRKLKLPDYSSKEILREKLLKAINIGRGSFQLS